MALMLLGTLVGSLWVGCDRTEPSALSTPAAAEIRIASLVPAVTNMLVELGQREKLAAVSNYDTDERVSGLPRVGDLLTIDWEQIAAVRPTHMVVQMSPERTPPGAVERAKQLGVKLVHVRLTRLNDVSETLATLQGAIDPDAADPWPAQLAARLDAARSQAASRPAVPTLIALGPTFEYSAGDENYLDDLLRLAGGANVVTADLPPYPKLDREALTALRPLKLVLILPDATDAQLAKARRNLAALEGAWGLTWDDVILFTDPYDIVPGWSVVRICQRLAEELHR